MTNTVDAAPDLLNSGICGDSMDPAAQLERAVEYGRRNFGDCEHCGERFTRRRGGKPQRFCSEPCRRAFHASTDEQRGASGATPALQSQLPALIQPKPETSAPVPAADFDWAADSSIVFQDRPATAVYFNGKDDLVIRQERRWDQDEDVFIFIPADSIGTFLDRLTDACGIPSAGRR